MPIGHPVTAAARRITYSRRSTKTIKEPEWVTRAWDAYDRLPELHFGVNTRSNIAQKFDYFLAERIDPQSEPNRIEQATAATRFFDSLGGPELMRRLVADLVVHFDVPGLAYLVRVTDEDDREWWDIYSTQELRKDKDGKMVRTNSDGSPLAGDKALVDEENVFVVWRPHPRDRAQADSPLRSSLEVAEQLILLNREMRARSLSRLGAGLFAIPDSMDLAAGDDDSDEGDPVESFQRELEDQLMTPISNAGSAAAVAPWVIQAAADDIDKMRHITFDRDWDVDRDDRQELIRRLANGMDLPPEILLGVADVNHWSAWLVSEQAVTMHVDPTVRTILDSLTSDWLYPLLQENRIDPGGLILWRDTTPAVVPADRSEQHIQAMRMGLIGFEAARERLGYDDNEKPDIDDLELIGWLIGRGDPSTGVPVQIGGETRGPAQTEPPSSETVPTDAPTQASMAPPEPAIIAAGGRTVALDELSDLDAAALEYTLGQAEAALDRVLEKAGARLRSQVQANPKLASKGKSVDNLHLAATLQGEFQAEDIIRPEDFSPVLQRIVARWGRTVNATHRFLAQLVEAEPLDQTQVDEDIDKGRSRLLAALMGAALAALYTPDAAPDPADVGEIRDVRIPVTDVREAMSLAGGGTATHAGSQAFELIANGYRTQQTLQKAGVATLSFTWRYGDPSARLTNFEPHRNLNGVSFDDWDDPAIAITPAGAWVGGTHYRPGDHRGCLCRYTRTITIN